MSANSVNVRFWIPRPSRAVITMLGDITASVRVRIPHPSWRNSRLGEKKKNCCRIKMILSFCNVTGPILCLLESTPLSQYYLSQLTRLMALFVLLKLILQTCMRSHPVGEMSDFCSDPSSTSILHVCEQRRLWRTLKVLARLLAWAFAGRLCDKYHNLMSWLIFFFNQSQI